MGWRPIPACGGPRVGHSLTPDRPSLGRATGAHYPLVVSAVSRRGGPAVLGTFSRGAPRRLLCALPGFAAPGGLCCLAPALVPWLWPAGCLTGVPPAPALVRRASSGPVALRAPVGFAIAVVPAPTRGAVAPGFTGRLHGTGGGRPRTWLIVPAVSPCGGRGAKLAPCRTRFGPGDGVVPGKSLRLRSWAACAAVVWRAWTGSLTRPVSRTVRLSTGDSAGAPGLFCVDADTSPFGSEDEPPGSRACVLVRALLGRAGQAGLLGAFFVLLTFPVTVLSFFFVRPPHGWGYPCFGFFFCVVPLMVGRALLVPVRRGAGAWCGACLAWVVVVCPACRLASLGSGCGVSAGAMRGLFCWIGFVSAALRSACSVACGLRSGCGCSYVVSLAGVGAVLVRAPPNVGGCCLGVFGSWFVVF